jgi:DNA mismatch repair protein MutL
MQTKLLKPWQRVSHKVWRALDAKEQQALLDDFFGCKETTVSPFNRQIFITLEKTEIEKKLN